MTTTIDYALLAGASYLSTRNPNNQLPIPTEWKSKFFHYENYRSEKVIKPVISF